MQQQNFKSVSKEIFETNFLRKLKKIVIHNSLDDVVNSGNFTKANITAKNYAEFMREVKNVKFILKVNKEDLDAQNKFKVVWYNKSLGDNAHCELTCFTDSNVVIYPKVWEDTNKTNVIKGVFDGVVKKFKNKKKNKKK